MKKILSFAAAFAALIAGVSCTKTLPSEPVNEAKVTVAPESISIMETEIAYLVPTCYGEAKNNVVEWNSSNRDVVTVSNEGKITGKSAGTATVTAKAGKYTGTCKVTVTPLDESVVPVVKIAVDPAEVTIVETRTATVTATVLPENATTKPQLVWSSSDEAVATVANGVITAVKEGECEVIVWGGAHKAAVKVKVIPDNNPTTEIVLSETDFKLAVGKSWEIKATLLPADHTDLPELTWTSSDKSVATVEDGVVTAVAEGEADITAAYGSVKAVAHVTVKDYPISVVANMYKNFLPVNWKNTSAVSSLKQITVEFLVRAEKWRNDAQNPVSSIFGIEGKWLIRIGDQGIGDANLQVAKGSNWTSGYNFDAGKWYHVAVVQNCTSRTIKLYVNGKLEKSGSAYDSSINLSTDCFISKSYDNSRYLQGELSELRVWKVERTAEEIAANMYRYTGDMSNLLAYWKFNEGEGKTVKDYSGNGNDLTANADINWIPATLPED